MLDDKRIKLVVDKEAKEWLADKGYDPMYGARALNRVITKSLRSPISAALIKGTIRPGDEAIFQKTDGGIELIEQHRPETVPEAGIIEEEEEA